MASKLNYKNVLIGTSCLILLLIGAAVIQKKYVWIGDHLFFGAVLFLLYLLRRTLNFTPTIFLLLAVLVSMHSAAVFGLYSVNLAGREYDEYVHLFSSVVIAMAAFQYMRKFRVSMAETAVVAVLITLGVGLLNELLEFAGYRLFGTGDSFFLLGPGDVGALNVFENLMHDFLNDFYGNCFGIAVSLTAVWVKRAEMRKDEGSIRQANE